MITTQTGKSSQFVSTQYLTPEMQARLFFAGSLDTHCTYDEVNEAVMEEDGD